MLPRSAPFWKKRTVLPCRVSATWYQVFALQIEVISLYSVFAGPLPRDLDVQKVLESKGFSTYLTDPDAADVTPADANLEHWWEPGAPHSEAAWHARLHRVFRFFFRK